MFRVLLAKRSDTPDAPEDAETLPGHLELVLRVAQTLLFHRRAAILDMLGLEAEPWGLVLEQAVLCAAALHDLGKANDQFQHLVRGDRRRQAYRHEVLSLLLLQQRPALDAWLFDGVPPIARALALRAVCGHHLRFSPDTSLQPQPSGQVTLRLLLDHPDVHAALQRANVFLARNTPPELDAFELALADEPARALAPWLVEMLAPVWADNDARRCAGAVLALLVAADICASAVVRQGIDPAQWAESALAAMLQTGDLEQIIKRQLAGGSLRPFQATVASSPPRLTLVTAGCGTGKTLAAYCWAARQAVGRRLFFCYPTTGTATEGFTAYAFPDFSDSAALIHSRAAYDLMELRASDDQPSAIEQAWSGLVPWDAPLSIGTVDAVLGLLQHARTGLTAFPALAGAAFVFDEIHLYDDRLFRTLLRFLAACRNAPVLLMTASLQPNRRASLERLAQQLGQRLTVVSGPADYETLPRYILQQADQEMAMAAVACALESGQHVLWIVNTVERAMEMAQMASKRGWPVALYHSRFRYRDRLNRHRTVVEAFQRGAASGPILAVTTQVCEVSLDISADLLVTEIAPPPALIQRLGRLNRWLIPGSHGKPALALVLTAPSAAPYCPNELEEGRQWLAQLSNRPVSQQDLRDAFEQLAPMNELLPATEVAWLDTMLDTTPRSLREPGTTIEVLREEDLSFITKRADAIAHAIPMLLGPVSQELPCWPRRFGIPVAPAGRIDYDMTLGARWSKAGGR
jgi:CRISPR-associated endonuclease/helicase Cas3